MSARPWWFAALLALLLPVAGARAGGCDATRIAELPVADVQGFLLLRAAIDGVPVSVLLDTGAEAGLLSPDAAARLGLTPDPAHRTLLKATGGTGGTVPDVVVQSLALGGLTWRGLSLPVGMLPGAPHVEPAVAGLLGADILAGYDLEIDLPRHLLALHSVPAACAARFVPWAAEGAAPASVPVRRDGDRLRITVELDGVALDALLDTGARALVLDSRAAARLGIGEAVLGAEPGGITAGVDLHETPFHWHRFRELRLAGETLHAPVLTITPLHGEADLLIGTSWFASRRVWLSYATGQMFVARR